LTWKRFPAKLEHPTSENPPWAVWRRMRKIFVAIGLLLGLALAFSSAQSNRLVVLPGTIQQALGGKAWTPSDEITRMTEVSADIYEFVAAFPKGRYEYKVAIGGTWDENYGKGGEKGGGNIVLEVANDNTIVKFVFNSRFR
jgi:hypothetical protein